MGPKKTTSGTKLSNPSSSKAAPTKAKATTKTAPVKTVPAKKGTTTKTVAAKTTKGELFSFYFFFFNLSFVLYNLSVFRGRPIFRLGTH